MKHYMYHFCYEYNMIYLFYVQMIIVCFLLGICNEVLHMITTINHRSVKKAETTPIMPTTQDQSKTTKGYVHQGAILAPSSANFTNFGTYLILPCYGNKNRRQNRLKTEKLPFWTKCKAFGDRFLKIRYQHS